MEKAWREVEPIGPHPAGDIGGDEQVTEAFGRRFVLPANGDGEHPVMTISFYVAYESPHDPADQRALLRRQIEYMLCGDPALPGDTEVWSDYSYVRVPFDGVPVEADARRACQEMPLPTIATWNGIPWRETKDSPWWRAGERP